MRDCACPFDFVRPIAAWQPVVKVRRGILRQAQDERQQGWTPPLVLRQAQDERQQGWTSPLVLRQAQDERYWLNRSW
jgi:hypothetical protein